MTRRRAWHVGSSAEGRITLPADDTWAVDGSLHDRRGSLASLASRLSVRRVTLPLDLLPPDPALDDPALDEVFEAVKAMDPDGGRAGRVLRATYDQLYDGMRTGRYRWDQLYKTEKTHFGTLVEINLQREFSFADGLDLDYMIAGHEVDAKYSQQMWAWMLPPEAVGQLCLVVWASDQRACYSMGVVRADEAHLNLGANRDAKKTLNTAGRQTVAWLRRDHPMLPNVLLQLPDEDVAAVFAARQGQQRVNELFRRAAGRVVGRAAVETCAQQLDSLKRVRGNGGARWHLGGEGIVILGGYLDWQREAARSLGLPVPGRSDFVSAYTAAAGPDWDGPAAVSPRGMRLRPAAKHTAEPVPRDFYDTGLARPPRS